MFTKRPDILYWADVDKFLEPKIQYLVDNGFKGPVLHDLIARNLRILFTGLDSRIKPSLQFLRESFGTDERARGAFRAFPWLFTVPPHWKLNVEFLINKGVAVETLAKSMLSSGKSMAVKAAGMRFAVNAAKELGLDPVDPKFLNYVLVLVYNPVWEKKVEVFKSFGWTEEEILSVFRRYPHCFDYPEKKLRSSMEFLLNTKKLKPKNISANPALLGYSIKNRVRRRYSELKLLLSKKLLEEEGSELVLALLKNEDVS